MLADTPEASLDFMLVTTTVKTCSLPIKVEASDSIALTETSEAVGPGAWQKPEVPAAMALQMRPLLQGQLITSLLQPMGRPVPQALGPPKSEQVRHGNCRSRRHNIAANAIAGNPHIRTLHYDVKASTRQRLLAVSTAGCNQCDLLGLAHRQARHIYNLPEQCRCLADQDLQRCT